MMPRKLLSYFLLPVFILFAAAGCKKVDINYGSQYLDNSLTQLIKVDTFGVDLSTVYIDSFPTSAKGVTLVGGYTDPLFGRIDSRTYFEITPPTTNAPDYVKGIYDSLYLTLFLNKNYYGDTTKPLHIEVSQLNQLITPFSLNGSTSPFLYNVDQYPVFPTPLGSTDLVVRPNLTDSIHIRLDDNLGRVLFSKIQTADYFIQNSSQFLSFFNGMRISSNASSNLIVGCKDSLTMHLVYHTPALYADTSSINFTLSNNAHHFVNITADRAGTALQNLGPAAAAGKQNVLPSAATGHAAYTQTSSGAVAKLRFPNVQNVLKIPNYLKVVRAELIIRPVVGTYNTQYYLPPQLRLSTTTLANQLGTDLTVPTASGSAVIQYGSLSLDYAGGQSSYTYDITTYIKSLVENPAFAASTDGLLLAPPSPAYETQFPRLVFGDKTTGIYNRIELDVYYVAVQTK